MANDFRKPTAIKSYYDLINKPTDTIDEEKKVIEKKVIEKLKKNYNKTEDDIKQEIKKKFWCNSWLAYAVGVHPCTITRLIGDCKFIELSEIIESTEPVKFKIDHVRLQADIINSCYHCTFKAVAYQAKLSYDVAAKATRARNYPNPQLDLIIDALGKFNISIDLKNYFKNG